MKLRKIPKVIYLRNYRFLLIVDYLIKKYNTQMIKQNEFYRLEIDFFKAVYDYNPITDDFEPKGELFKYIRIDSLDSDTYWYIHSGKIEKEIEFYEYSMTPQYSNYAKIHRIYFEHLCKKL